MIDDGCLGYGRAAGTGPPHSLSVQGHLIARKDGFGSTAGCADGCMSTAIAPLGRMDGGRVEKGVWICPLPTVVLTGVNRGLGFAVGRDRGR